MATPEQILELRALINEPGPTVYTDEALSNRIDSIPEVNLRVLAASIWREKAARFASMVDIKEGNSDRKLSQLHSQALSMATALGGAEDEAVVNTRPTRTRKIERQ